MTAVELQESMCFVCHHQEAPTCPNRSSDIMYIMALEIEVDSCRFGDLPRVFGQTLTVMARLVKIIEAIFGTILIKN